MAIFAETLDDLVETICKLHLHDWVEGAATADGTTATVKDTSLAAYADDYFNDQNSWIYIRSGAYAGHWAKISNFAVAGSPAVGTITFAPVAGGNIVTGVTYSIHTEFTHDEVVEAINLAINKVAERAMVWKIDEASITLVASTYEYSLPTDFMYIYRVTMANSTGGFDDMPEIPPDQYRVVPGATPKLRFCLTHGDERFAGHYLGQLWAETDLTATRKLRVEGLGSPDVLTNDTDTCPISPAYVTFQAAAFLHLSRVKRMENDPDENAVRYKLCQDQANIERAMVVSMQLPVNSKRIRE